MEEDLETGVERNSSTSLEGNTSARMEETLYSRMDKGRHSWRTLSWKRPARLGIHFTRSMEEEVDLETNLEEILEDREETDLGAQ